MSGTKLTMAAQLALLKMTGLTMTGLKTTGLAMAAVALVATSCTSADPQEVVAGALEQHRESAGTYTATMAGGSGADDPLFTIVLNGGWDSDLSWSSVDRETMYGDTESGSEFDFDPTAMPVSTHEVVRGEERLFGEEWADGRVTWMRLGAGSLPESEPGVFGNVGAMNPTDVLNNLKATLDDGGADLSGEGSYTVNVPAAELVHASFIEDPNQYQGHSDNPDQVEDSIDSLMEWLENDSEVPVHLGINSDGVLETLSIRIDGTEFAEFPDCEPLHTLFDASTTSEIKWVPGDGTPPFDVPSEDEILTQDEYFKQRLDRVGDGPARESAEVTVHDSVDPMPDDTEDLDPVDEDSLMSLEGCPS